MRVMTIVFLCLAEYACWSEAAMISAKDKVITHTVRIPVPSRQKIPQDRLRPRRGYGYRPFLGLLRSASGDELVLDLGESYYAVSLNTRPAVREITGQVFQSAERVKDYTYFTGDYPKGEGIKVSKERIEYKGKSFGKGGNAALARVYPSQRGTWIAVIGYGYKRQGLLNLPPIHGGGGGPEIGAEYLDVYDVSSGEKMLLNRIKRSDPERNGSFDSLIWIDDRYLIVPMENGLQSFLLAVFPKK